MKLSTKEKIHNCLDNEKEAEMILLDFGFKWFMFGFSVGGIVTLIIFNFISR